jgi:predicted peptidase
MILKFRPYSTVICLLITATIFVSCGETNSEQIDENEQNTETSQEPEQEEKSTMTPESDSQISALREASLTYKSITLTDGARLDYALFVPAGYDPERIYPILLALPPGGQTRGMVDAGINGYWGYGPVELDWIVISPVAPNGQLFFQGSERLIPEFLEEMASLYPPEGGKFHLAGISNGGISAFRLAVNQPDKFRSILVVPGFPRDGDFQKLGNLMDIPVAMFVGERDTSWHQAMIDTEEELSRLNIPVTLEVVSGERHVIQGIGGEDFFELLETFR